MRDATHTNSRSLTAPRSGARMINYVDDFRDSLLEAEAAVHGE
jgi:hypothetical protein